MKPTSIEIWPYRRTTNHQSKRISESLPSREASTGADLAMSCSSQFRTLSTIVYIHVVAIVEGPSTLIRIRCAMAKSGEGRPRPPPPYSCDGGRQVGEPVDNRSSPSVEESGAAG